MQPIPKQTGHSKFHTLHLLVTAVAPLVCAPVQTLCLCITPALWLALYFQLNTNAGHLILGLAFVPLCLLPTFTLFIKRPHQDVPRFPIFCKDSQKQWLWSVWLGQLLLCVSALWLTIAKVITADLFVIQIYTEYVPKNNVPWKGELACLILWSFTLPYLLRLWCALPFLVAGSKTPIRSAWQATKGRHWKFYRFWLLMPFGYGLCLLMLSLIFWIVTIIITMPATLFVEPFVLQEYVENILAYAFAFLPFLTVCLYFPAALCALLKGINAQAP